MSEGLYGTDFKEIWNFWMDERYVTVWAGFRWAVRGTRLFLQLPVPGPKVWGQDRWSAEAFPHQYWQCSPLGYIHWIILSSLNLAHWSRYWSSCLNKDKVLDKIDTCLCHNDLSVSKLDCSPSLPALPWLLLVTEDGRTVWQQSSWQEGQRGV